MFSEQELKDANQDFNKTNIINQKREEIRLEVRNNNIQIIFEKNREKFEFKDRIENSSRIFKY